MKTIGKKRELTPEENLHRLAFLNAQMKKLRPYEIPKGIVRKFKTWAEHDDFVIKRAANRQ